ncbi:MAG: TetR/AcrR family transcriptional regulator [Cyanobacteria bacterium P01_G01_bin.38]
MPRPKSFDKDQLLGEAMVLFWEKGYDKTSLKDLEKLFGLTPPSIYNTFGNKHDLFLSVLDHYLEQVVESRIARYLGQTPNPIHDLEHFFRSAVGYWVEGKPRFGCLLTNSAILPRRGRGCANAPALTETIDQKIQAGLTQLRDAFHQELVRAKTTGYLKPEQDPAVLATMLLTSYQGLLVLARLKVSDEALEQNVGSIISTLDR